MRTELSWSVAGIPPEAREAARAAARREGMPVGEWLAKRILVAQQNGCAETPMADARNQTLASGQGEAAIERHKAATTDTDIGDLTRRMVEQLRGVSQRLGSTDTAGRGSAAQDGMPAEAIARLSAQIAHLTSRMDQLERKTGESSMREAAKILHQGLSRLSDQVTQTANESAAQTKALTHNLETLAERLEQTRRESEAAASSLEHRLSSTSDTLKKRTAAVEKSVKAIENQIRSDASPQEIANEAIAKLENDINTLNGIVSEGALDKRLNRIEQSLGDIVSRLDVKHAGGGADDQLRRIERRLEHFESRLADGRATSKAVEEEPSEAATGSLDQTIPPPAVIIAEDFESILELTEADEIISPPPRVVEEPAAAETVPEATEATETISLSAEAAGETDADDGTGPSLPALSEDDEIASDEPDPEMAEEPPSEEGQTGPEPKATRSVAADLGPVSFLEAARKSAKIAAAQGVPDRRPTGSFTWSGDQAFDIVEPSTGRNRLLLPALLLATLVLAIIASIALLNWRVGDQPPSDQTGATAQSATSQAGGVTYRNGSGQTASNATGGQATAETNTTNAQQPSPAALDRLTALANKGDALAETIVGFRYLNGEGTDANPLLAAKWLERAAEQGQAVAQARLAKMYEDGQGVTKDTVKAVRWYQAAAAQGNRIAMHNLALAYHDGRGMSRDLSEAVRWFLKAASLGVVDSQVNLAILYERGEGVPQSLLDAYKWYLIAAAQGDSDARNRSEAIQTQLSADDRAAAERSAASFHAANMNLEANAVPQLSDLGGN